MRIMSKFYQNLSLLDRSYKKKYFFLIFLLFISSVLELFSLAALMPLLFSLTQDSNLINIISSKTSIDLHFFKSISVQYMILTFFLIYISKILFILFTTHYKNKFIFNLQGDLYKKLFKEYINKKYSFHLNKNSSLIVRNLTENINMYSNGYVSSSLNIFLEILTVFFLTVLFLIFQTNFTIIVIFSSLCLLTLGLVAINSKTKKLGERRQKSNLKNLQTILESFEGIREIKIFSKENIVINNFNKNIQNLVQTNFTIEYLNESVRLFFEFVVIISILILIYIFSSLNIPIISTVNYIIIIFAVLIRLVPSSSKLFSAYIRASVSVTSFNLLNDILKKKTKLETNLPGSSIIFNKEIKLKNLGFSYNEPEKKILINTSLTIKKGEMIGIEGETGSGKSTFLDLLMGLLTPSKGGIYVDEINIKKNIRSWMDQIGYVPQNVFLLDTTIKENISFFNLKKFEKNKILNKIKDIIKKVQLNKYIQSLPNGIETHVGQRGSNISGGQRQRIGIARALYVDPSVLILDECTSALDEKTEDKLIKELNNLKKNRTIIISSHNKKMFKYCDRIFIIKEGFIEVKKNEK